MYNTACTPTYLAQKTIWCKLPSHILGMATKFIVSAAAAAACCCPQEDRQAVESTLAESGLHKQQSDSFMANGSPMAPALDDDDAPYDPEYPE